MNRQIHTDVVVVGARCAGSTVAQFLRRRGVEVCLLDRATFPRDTISTHMFQFTGAAVLAELGVLSDLQATGAPAHREYAITVDGIDLTQALDRVAPDPPGGYSIRRHLLDAILLRSAREAGVDVRESARVTALLHDHRQRVCGVVAEDELGPFEIRASVVVGADGRASTVAKLVGAKAYDVRPNERFACWGYFEGYAPEPVARMHFHKIRENAFFAWPSDSGLLTVIVMPPKSQSASFLANESANFSQLVSQCGPIAAQLDGATRVGGLRRLQKYPGYFRCSAGPGWVLVGDAGHFKDPILGQGMSDAFRQSRELATAIASGLEGSVPIDDSLQRWWRWRDSDARQMYWLAQDQGSTRPLQALDRALLTEVSNDPVLRRRFVVDVLAHRCAPTAVFTPSLVGRALRRAKTDGTPTTVIARQAAGLILREATNRIKSAPPGGLRGTLAGVGRQAVETETESGALPDVGPRSPLRRVKEHELSTVEL